MHNSSYRLPSNYFKGLILDLNSDVLSHFLPALKELAVSHVTYDFLEIANVYVKVFKIVTR